ncbi:hypothetical protein GCM10011578_073180 [Streptomyces fuscichromogenes]|uniref:Carboxymuconolactone decarboxylase-like domain-containing protein n=1 Tax=Streptomyces fuscichromogenes TaxID=1324013 RepID=A0A918CVJ5_9ACTN|nr:hypothetical protein GCM10011578_073180 [Streptomyces fuscichromogenes]
MDSLSVTGSPGSNCGMCLDSHERVLRRAGVDREVIQEAFEIASVVGCHAGGRSRPGRGGVGAVTPGTLLTSRGRRLPHSWGLRPQTPRSA